MLKWTVQRPRSAFPTANVQPAEATAPGRLPASTGRAGSEEDLTAGSGEQDAAGPRGDGRARKAVSGGEDARSFVEAPRIPAAFGNTVDEDELTDLPLQRTSILETSLPRTPNPMGLPRACGLPEEANDPSV